jgi:hypothetical protein
LIVMGTNTKEFAKLIVFSAEATRRSMAFEGAHTSNAAFDTAVILFEPVVQVGIRLVLDRIAKRRADSPWVRAVPARRHPIPSKAHSCSRRSAEPLGCRHVPGLAEHGVDQAAVAVDRDTGSTSLPRT